MLIKKSVHDLTKVVVLIANLTKIRHNILSLCFGNNS